MRFYRRALLASFLTSATDSFMLLAITSIGNSVLTSHSLADSNLVFSADFFSCASRLLNEFVN